MTETEPKSYGEGNERPTIAFFQGSGLLPKTIMRAIGSTVSHTAIGGADLFGTKVFIHASIGGVQACDRATMLAAHHMVAEFRILADVDTQNAVKKLGEKYNYVGLFGFLPVILAWRWFKKRLRNPFSSPHALVCSELVRELDPEGAVIPEWKERSLHETDPGWLYEWCQKDTLRFERLT